MRHRFITVAYLLGGSVNIVTGIQVGRLGNRGSIRGRNKDFPFRVGDIIYVWYRKFSLETREKCGKSVS